MKDECVGTRNPSSPQLKIPKIEEMLRINFLDLKKEKEKRDEILDSGMSLCREDEEELINQERTKRRKGFPHVLGWYLVPKVEGTKYGFFW
jgi:hypothetical protein